MHAAARSPFARIYQRLRPKGDTGRGVVHGQNRLDTIRVLAIFVTLYWLVTQVSPNP